MGNSYISSAFSGVPTNSTRIKIKTAYPTQSISRKSRDFGATFMAGGGGAVGRGGGGQLEGAEGPQIKGDTNKGGQNQNWPTSWRKCYMTPAFSGVPK